MNSIENILENSNVRDMGLTCNSIDKIEICEICGEPIGKLVTMPFGTRLYPRACRCKREYNKIKNIENKNEQKQIRLNQVISNSLITKNFRECTLENWNHKIGNEKLYEIAKTYTTKFSIMKNKNHGILIYGKPGNGKSYFSACIANYLLKRFVPVICVGSISLTERISQSRRNFGEEGICTVLNTLENADLLILDDLGTEEDNKWTRAMIYQIIEKRNVTELPVIVTTNISLDELKERYDDRTYSRLVKMCSFIENKGEDIRKIQGSEKDKNFAKEIIGDNMIS